MSRRLQISAVLCVSQAGQTAQMHGTVPVSIGRSILDESKFTYDTIRKADKLRGNKDMDKDFRNDK